MKFMYHIAQYGGYLIPRGATVFINACGYESIAHPFFHSFFIQGA